MSNGTCGTHRFANRFTIRGILDDHGISMAELGRRIGVTPETVSATIRGKMHSPRVLDALKAIGVPSEFLFDPRNKEKDAA